MAIFTWNNGEVPKNISIKQIYGLIFTKDGRLLLRVFEENGIEIYSLAGGKPESFDKDMSDTLKRELLEEVNVTVKNPIIAGYQEVDEENGRPSIAQVRMVAIIDKIGKIQPDPDTGLTYKRFLTHPKNAIKLLNWGNVGKAQIEEAVKIAKEKLGLNSFLDKDQFI